MISDWIMSLRKCEKLIAPSTLKRVRVRARVRLRMPAKLCCMSRARMMRVSDHAAYPTSYFDRLSCENAPMNRFEPYVFLRGPRVALGRAGVHRRHRPDRLSRRDRARPVRAAVPARGDRRCRSIPSHLPEYAARTTFRMLAALFLLAGVHADLRDLGGEERARRQAAGAHPRHSAVGADSGFHFHYKRVLPVAGARAGCSAPNSWRSSPFSPARPGTWRSASISRCAPSRPSSSRPPSRSGCRRGCASGSSRCPFGMPALVWNMMMSMSGGWFFVVASESISVGHTVGRAAGRRVLHRARHRAEEPARHRLGDRHHADRDPAVRPAAVPAAGGLGRPVPGGAGARRARAGFLGARP